MANLPICANFREGKCPRSDLRIAAETPNFFTFNCHTCGLEWVWSKPRMKEEARYDRELKRVREATERDRIQSEKALVFGAPKGGWA